MAFVIYHDLPINSSPERIFKAVTDPSELEKWWPLKCSGKPEENETYNFNFTNQYDWYARVSEVKPNQSISFKMTQSDANWNPTTFGFEIEKTENGCLLHFSHSNWPSCNAHFKTASYCWAILLLGLKNYLEKGEIIPFEKRA